MEWLYSLFVEHSALQAVVVLSLISAIGLGLGKIHICGISLGVTFVFFAGILAGHFGLSIDPQMLNYAESFGLIIFVYALGLQVGPGFFSSFRKGGVQLNMLALGVVLLGTLMTVLGSYTLNISLPDMVGWMMCAIMFVSTVSALTLTPMLCSQLLRLQRKQSKMFRIFFGPIEHTLDGLDNWYARMLNWAVRHRMVVLVGCVIFFILSLFCAKTIGTEFFPAQDNARIAVQLELQLLFDLQEDAQSSGFIAGIGQQAVRELKAGERFTFMASRQRQEHTYNRYDKAFHAVNVVIKDVLHK